MAEPWLPFPALRFDTFAGGILRLASADPAYPEARVEICRVEGEVVRVHLLPYGAAEAPRTHGVVGRAGDVGRLGRERDDLSVFSSPSGVLEEAAERFTLRAEGWTLQVSLDPFTLTATLADGRVLLCDHPEMGYALQPPGPAGPRRGIRHTLRRDPEELILGLGEVAGGLDRHHRRYRLRPGDALGYDAQFSDPLYKHWPLHFTLPPHGAASGLLYDTGAEVRFDFGSEVDHYLGPYRYAEFEARHLEFYLLLEPSVPGLVRTTQALLGGMPLPPRWMFGYLGSTMAYTDAEDPTAALAGFTADLERHALGCSGFHLSSGYSMGDDGLRYVFEWNRRRVPEPQAMTAPLRAAGIRTLANIKPALLETHPEHARLAAAGAFVRPPDGGAGSWYRGRFWGGAAGFIDFTHPAGYDHWVARVRERILENGIDGTWNDNNEFRIQDDEATCAAGRAGDLRPTLTLLMNHASRSAQRAQHPERRDAQVTRSGGLGTHRYAHTWSGDNQTSWRTLAYNLPMGLSMSLSGWFHHGHDVGGFAGPAPDPELLVRWIEGSVAQPRFCIHSWNDDGSATEPWMYPEMLPAIRRLLRLRTALVPYLQTLAWRAVTAAEPFTRPLVYAFPDWRAGWRESFVHMLGEALLVAPVVEAGATTRSLHLPPGRWLALGSGEVLSGDAWVTLPAPLGAPVWLLREGAMLPLVREIPDEPRQPGWLVGAVGAAPPAIDYLAFPNADGVAHGSLHWDDGLSRAAQDAGAFDQWQVRVAGGRAEVASTHAGFGAGPRDQRVLVPGGSERVRGFALGWRPLG